MKLRYVFVLSAAVCGALTGCDMIYNPSFAPRIIEDERAAGWGSFSWQITFPSGVVADNSSFSITRTPFGENELQRANPNWDAEWIDVDNCAASSNAPIPLRAGTYFLHLHLGTGTSYVARTEIITIKKNELESFVVNFNDTDFKSYTRIYAALTLNSAAGFADGSPLTFKEARVTFYTDSNCTDGNEVASVGGRITPLVFAAKSLDVAYTASGWFALEVTNGFYAKITITDTRGRVYTRQTTAYSSVNIDINLMLLCPIVLNSNPDEFTGAHGTLSFIQKDAEGRDFSSAGYAGCEPEKLVTIKALGNSVGDDSSVIKEIQVEFQTTPLNGPQLDEAEGGGAEFFSFEMPAQAVTVTAEWINPSVTTATSIHSYNKITYTFYDTLAEAVNLTSSGGVIYILKNLTVNGNQSGGFSSAGNSITIDKQITLRAKKKSVTIKRGSVTNSFFNVQSPDGDLSLECGNAALTLDGGAQWQGGTPASGCTDSNSTKAGNSIITVAGKLTLNHGVTLQNNDNTATSAVGGAVWVNGGIFTMKGGSIKNNACNANGGSSEDGGAVFINNGGMFDMCGGRIEGNGLLGTATSKLGGAVYVGSANSPVFKMSGAAVIDANNNVYLSGDRTITIDGDLNGAAPVATIDVSGYSLSQRVLTQIAGANYLTPANTAKFTLSADTHYLEIAGNNIGLAILNSAGTMAARRGSTNYPTLHHAIAAATGSAGLPDEIKILTNIDMTADEILAVEAVWGSAHKHIKLTSDLSGTPAIKELARTENDTGAFFTLNSGSSLTLANIKLDGNSASYSANAPLVQVNGGSFAMRDGASLINADRNDNGDIGSAVELAGGSFKMSGTVSLSGGNVFLAKGKTITIEGAINNGGAGIKLYFEEPSTGLIVLDSPAASLVSANYNYFDANGDSWSIDSSGKLAYSSTYPDGTLAVLQRSDGNITYYTTANYTTGNVIGVAINAAQDGDSIELMPNNYTVDNSSNYAIQKNITIYASEATATIKRATNGNYPIFTVQTNGRLTLGEDGSSPAALVLDGTQNTQCPLVSVASDSAYLIIQDGVKLCNNKFYALGVNRGNAEMTGGEISGNYNTKNSNDTDGGGGVRVNEGTFTMSGGVIKNNTSKKDGGGVYIAKGTFNMNGGIIKNNTAENTAEFHGGGGVYINSSSGAITMFNLSGSASIENNTAKKEGGGVYVYGVYSVTVNMTGGSIKNNTSQTTEHDNDGGGGVVIYGSNAAFNMSNGYIRGNTTSGKDGGGVYLYAGSFSMSGGSIAGNKTTHLLGRGGGVSVGGIGTFTKSGGTIYGNNAASDADKNTATNGQAVFVNNGSKKRDSTADDTVNLDSSVSGSSGGWDP